MSKGWKIRNPDGVYFITFAVVEWIDVFNKQLYKEEFIKSLKYCQENKGGNYPFNSQGKRRMISLIIFSYDQQTIVTLLAQARRLRQ
jgi:hypothetical protein